MGFKVITVSIILICYIIELVVVKSNNGFLNNVFSKIPRFKVMLLEFILYKTGHVLKIGTLLISSSNMRSRCII
jgi:hypothetical protein